MRNFKRSGNAKRLRTCFLDHRLPAGDACRMASILPPRREPSGKRQRRTADAQNEHNRRLAELEQAVVLAQPHRRGDASPLAATALGRFVLAHDLDRDCYAAAEDFRVKRNRFRAVVGAQKLENIDGTGDADGPDMELVRKWRDELAHIERACIEAATSAGFTLLSRLIDSEIDIAPKSVRQVRYALVAMARVMGRRV
jgi:hypothetical protein